MRLQTVITFAETLKQQLTFMFLPAQKLSAASFEYTLLLILIHYNNYSVNNILIL